MLEMTTGAQVDDKLDRLRKDVAAQDSEHKETLAKVSTPSPDAEGGQSRPPVRICCWPCCSFVACCVSLFAPCALCEWQLEARPLPAWLCLLAWPVVCS